MRKYILLGSLAFIMLMILGGCDTTSEYCCTRNDQCLETSEGLHSCSDDTCGKCVLVEPLIITPTTLPDATVGQSNYSVELTVTGGHPPYKWGDPTKGDKLSWLTLVPDENNNDKAWLKNVIYNGQPVPPSEPGEGLSIKVTATDDTKRGTDIRGDNQGAVLDSNIKINDCPRECERLDSTKISTGTKCEDGKLYDCKPYFTTISGDCMEWDEVAGQCTTKMCQTKGSNANVSCCDYNCGGSTRCNNGDIEKCSEDELGCLASWVKQNQCPNQSECKPDGSSCIDCIDECPKSGDHQCSSNNTSINTCEINITTGCLGWSLFGQCDTGKTCVDATCKYVVGNTGAGGGRIFWVNSDGSQYLEATLQDQSSGAQWGCMNYTMGSSGQGIGNGENNTSAIVSNCSDTGIAAKLCSGQNLGNGYTDWFLPSHDELKEMYNMKAGIGGFASSAYGSSWYWSSSEYVDNSKYYAMDVNFNDPQGFVSMATKASSEHVRCVRSGP